MYSIERIIFTNIYHNIQQTKLSHVKCLPHLPSDVSECSLLE